MLGKQRRWFEDQYMHREIKKIYPYFNVCVFVFTIWIAPAMQDLHLVQSDILDGICSAMS